MVRAFSPISVLQGQTILIRTVMNLATLICSMLVWALLIWVIQAYAMTDMARADILPKEMKPVYVTAVIENLDAYPDHVFAAVETLGSEIRSARGIGPDGRVSKSYKLNRMEILAIPRSEFERAGGLDKLDLLTEGLWHRSGDQVIACGMPLLPRPTSVAGKEVYYRVVLGSSGELSLVQTRERVFREDPDQFPRQQFALGFAMTLAAELCVFFLIRFFWKKRPGNMRSAAAVVCAQLLTLPLLWFMVTRYDLVGPLVIFGAESFAVGAEALVYRAGTKLSWTKAAIASLACNLTSWCVGLMV